jgi:plasmid stability protein
MNQLTVRGFDDDLSASLRRLAKREGISLNQAALRLLRKGAGLTDGQERANTVGSSLDHLIGKWTETEALQFDSALQVFESIDEELWR